MSWLIWFFSLDPTDLLILAGVLGAAVAARRRVFGAIRHAAIPAKRTGSEAASLVLRADRIEGVTLARTAEEPTNHFDARSRTLRLSPGVFDGATAATVGLAAHEAGHAAEAAGTRLIRSLLTPWTGLVARAGWLILASGVVLDVERLFHGGAWILAASLLAALAGLPIEFGASRRALKALEETGIGGPEVRAVTAAAAWTTVAGLLPLLPGPSSAAIALDRLGPIGYDEPSR